MTGIDSWAIVAATNATADGGSINWAEGQAPSTVNNTARQMLADVRAAFNDLAWFVYGTGNQGAGNLAVPAVYASGTSFTIAGADVTTIYTVGRRLRAVGSGTGTIYGRISVSAYAPTTTTITAVWDSGSLSNETLVISLSQVPTTGKPLTPLSISRPSFAAVKTTTSTNQTGNGTNQTVTYDTELFDNGANFAASIFTAPITGVYRFSARVVVSALTAAMTNQQIAIITTGKTFVAVQDVLPIASGSLYLSIDELVSMTAGDTALIKVQVSNGAGNTASFYGDATTAYTTFCGEMVS